MFTLTSGEQEFYGQQQMSEPKRCSQCRQARKINRETDGKSRDGNARVEEAKRAMDALFRPTKN